ncbi:MAG: aspartyl protease family protein [Candidatus Rokubacteria bacterium]|nr:aspartyl protease family protein [Candidatus Rokubacteria bacterium]
MDQSVGQFRVVLSLYPRRGDAPRYIDALVDSGAGYSVVPRSLLESLGYGPVRRQRVVLADGRVEEWLVSQVEVECEGRRATTPILMGPAASPVLLGATTLEELGLGIDPLNRRLVPVDLYLARAGWLRPLRPSGRSGPSSPVRPRAPAPSLPGAPRAGSAG